MSVAQELINCHSKSGGDSVAVLSDNRSLHMDGADVRYVDYTRYCPRQWFNRKELGVDILTGRGWGRRYHLGRSFVPAIEAVRESEADAVLLYDGNYAAAALPWWEAVRPRAKIILYVHNPLSRTYSKSETIRLLRHADAVIFCAEHLRQKVVDRVGPLPIPSYVVHNGIGEVFLTGHPRSDAAESESFHILFAGKVASHKGPHVLLEALALARDRTNVALSAEIVGSGNYTPSSPLTTYEQELRTYAAERHLDVTFTPFVSSERLFELYHETSAVCIPSIWVEGFPLVALEAMASGAPVICSKAPGLIEACGDAAAYAAFNDAGDLASVIVWLAEDQASLREFSIRGWNRAQGFHWEDTDRQINEIINSL